MKRAITKAAYARHRACSEAAVRKALTTGRISANPDGTIDPEKADHQWRERTDATKVTRGRTTAAPAGLMHWRVRRERALALAQERENHRIAGTLVERDAVARAIFDRVRIVRDRLLGIADRVDSDSKKCHDIVYEEIHATLTELSGVTPPPANGRG